MRAAYDSPAFWNQAYAAHGKRTFEWAGLGFGQLALDEVIPRDARVLIVGNGTSRLGHDMRDAGRSVTLLDFSEVAIGTDEPGLRWVLGDAREMSFDAEYQAVVDKGTVDAMHLSAADDDSIERLVVSAARALEPDGVFVVYSFSGPDYVWPLLLTAKTGPLWNDPPRVRRLDSIFMYTVRRSRRRSI